MTWYLKANNPRIDPHTVVFPVSAGRSGSCTYVLKDPTVSVRQFELSEQSGHVFLQNLSMTNPTVLDGEPCIGSAELTAETTHSIEIGGTVFFVSPFPGFNKPASQSANLPNSTVDMFVFRENGIIHGPMTLSQLTAAWERGTFKRTSVVWKQGSPETTKSAAEMFEFPDDSDSETQNASTRMPTRFVTAEESAPVPGESFMCPYCRTVTRVEDVLSVSTSPSLRGDPVLGASEQSRFLPSRFTSTGLAIDSEGGVCTELACPRCHLQLPQALLNLPQVVMAVVGAESSGKSFFLGSAVWQCRQILSRQFGVRFMDLDPAANKWILDYEETLFFDRGSEKLQIIRKSEVVGNADHQKEVRIDGTPTLLPMPSFFKVRARDGIEHALMLYDSAGEHFLVGGDRGDSLVTMNLLSADVLYFLYDPSADNRFSGMLDRGTGTATRGARRQDTVLSEMAARIRRHLGTRGEEQLTRPLFIGISKADMLRAHLPLTASLYRSIGDANGSARMALDLDALRIVSDETETLLDSVAPETVSIAHDIASEVWFVPVSAIGHNPAQEGIRPSDVHPVWAEIPIVFTLAKNGLLPTIGTGKR